MATKLNIPRAGEPLRLGTGRFPGPKIRGAKARREAWRALEAEEHARGALLRTVLICYCLWAGFWLQFLTSFVFDLPRLHVLSGGQWFLQMAPYRYPHELDYLVVADPEKALPFSIAHNFIIASTFGVAMAWLGGWLGTRGVPGKWRMRFVILVFSILTLGYAWLALPAESIAWRDLKAHREYLWQDSLMENEPWRMDFLRRRIDEIDDMLEKHGK